MHYRNVCRSFLLSSQNVCYSRVSCCPPGESHRVYAQRAQRSRQTNKHIHFKDRFSRMSQYKHRHTGEYWRLTDDRHCRPNLSRYVDPSCRPPFLTAEVTTRPPELAVIALVASRAQITGGNGDSPTAVVSPCILQWAALRWLAVVLPLLIFRNLTTVRITV